MSRQFSGSAWYAEEETLQLYIDRTRVTVKITLFDYGNMEDHMKLEISSSNQHLGIQTGTFVSRLTPLLEFMRQYLYKDIRRELPDNRTAEKQRLLIVKAMQELM